MNEDTVEKKKIELSPAQIAGSALAAVSGAFFASWAGTAGTLVGAALGSVIATVGAAMYTHSLRRTSEAVRRTAAQVRATALVNTGAVPRGVPVFPTREQEDLAAEAGREADQDSVLSRPVAPPRRWSLPWGRLALVSAAVMLVALAALTGFETLTGKPVSAYTGGSSQGTTLGHAVGADHATTKAKPTKKKSTGTSGSSSTPTPTPSPSPTPTPTPTPSPSPVVPTPSGGSTPLPTLPPATPTP